MKLIYYVLYHVYMLHVRMRMRLGARADRVSYEYIGGVAREGWVTRETLRSIRHIWGLVRGDRKEDGKSPKEPRR